MPNTLTGIIHDIRAVKLIGTKGFEVREFVLHVPNAKNSDYDDYILLQCVGGHAGLPDAYEAGERVTVSFDVRGRYNGERIYNNLNVWKIARDVTEGKTPSGPVPLKHGRPQLKMPAEDDGDEIQF